MSRPHPSNGVLVELTDFLLLAGTGFCVWWLVDMAVPAEWCAGGRWDAIFLFPLLMLFFARFLKPPRGRIRWAQSALLAACAAAATPAAVMAGRLIAGCTDVEGRVGVLVMLPHLLAGFGIGLVAVAAYSLLAKRLPAAEGEPPDMNSESTGQSIAHVTAMSGGVLFVMVWPDLVDAAATALLGGYCPNTGTGSVMYALVLIVLIGAVRDGGRAAWRPIAITALAGFAVMSAADVLAGLAIACPPAGEDLHTGQPFPRLFIRAVGFALAVVPIIRLRGRYQPQPETPDEDEQATRETGA